MGLCKTLNSGHLFEGGKVYGRNRASIKIADIGKLGIGGDVKVFRAHSHVQLCQHLA